MNTTLRICIVIDQLSIGGTTSALFPFLNELLKLNVLVTLKILRRTDFPVPMSNDRLLIEYMSDDRKSSVFDTLMFYAAFGWILSLINRLVRYWPDERMKVAQHWSRLKAFCQRKDQRSFDVAIAFMEMWPTYYVSYNITAVRKIAWLHLDYIGSRLDSSVDRKIYAMYDLIAVVSNKCYESFSHCFPLLRAKTIVVKNILPRDKIIEMANEVDPQYNSEKRYSWYSLITVCRIDIPHKGLDRIFAVATHLIENGIKFHWTILGDGPDLKSLMERTIQLGLSNYIEWKGRTYNPYMYIAKSDLMVLMSRYEGMPIVVDEARILCVPSLVTSYHSASEQIQEGITGYIVENRDDSVGPKLCEVLRNPEVLARMRSAMRNVPYENDIQKIANILF